MKVFLIPMRSLGDWNDLGDWTSEPGLSDSEETWARVTAATVLFAVIDDFALLQSSALQLQGIHVGEVTSTAYADLG